MKASSIVAGKVFVAVLLLLQQLCCITHAFIAPTHHHHGVVLRPSLSSYHPTSSFASFYLHQRQVTLSVAASPIMMDYDKTAVTTFLIQTVISTAVPTTAVIVTMLVLATLIFRDKKNSGAAMGFDYNDDDDDDMDNNDLYSDLYDNNDSKQDGSGLISLFKRFVFGSKKNKKFKSRMIPKKVNMGIPSKEYITIENLNDKYDSYEYSIMAATSSNAKAKQIGRDRQLQRAMKKAFSSSNSDEYTKEEKWKLGQAEQLCRTEGKELLQTIRDLQYQIMKSTMIHSTANTTDSSTSTLSSKLSKAQKNLLQIELDFCKTVMDIASKDGEDQKRAEAIQVAWLGDVAARGTGGLVQLLLSQASNSFSSQPPCLFVTRFNGDISASQVEQLREEVTAIVRTAKPGIDEALLVLESGGGTVTGYGLAAGQLKRFKDHNITLTVCVEQVAASGGYMMCCVADKIIASPFAVLGSIGVISDIPNVYQRLKDEGIEFQTVTAGKYKRTLTPTKQVTQEDLEKSKEDIEEILTLFKEFVHQNRPSLDIDDVATGETWFGSAAMDKGLCDEIRAVDDVLLDHVKNGYQVLDVKYTPPKEKESLKQLLGVRGGKEQKKSCG